MAIVYSNGSKEITVAASDKISASSAGPFKVFKQVGYPNFPDSWELQDSVDSAPYAYTSAAVSAETIFRIDAGANDVSYVMGTGANAAMAVKYQAEPVTANAAGTLTAATIQSGIITTTQSTGATIAVTLPPGAALDAGGDFGVNDAFDVTFINLSAAAANTVTLTATTGISIVGEPIVQSAHSTTGGLYGNVATLCIRKTAADTFIAYRKA